MSIKAKVRTDSQGNITVHMEGGLNYENTTPLKEELELLTKENPASQITIDINRLDFVGSSGISFFVDTIKALNKNKDQIRISNATNEFIKVFKLYELDMMTVIEDEFDNDSTEFLSQRFSNRKRTFQN
jgi:anti-sigma B factor antagonist